MTVCIAAISGGTCVYGASDRMITSWVIEFEPEQNQSTSENKSPPAIKALPLTNSIVAMIAGQDMSLQSQLIYDLQFILTERIRKDPANWWTVSDVANRYKDLYSFRRNQLAEQQILIPRGLSYESFISRQHEMNPQFLAEVHAKIANFHLPDLSVIFAGVDPSGPHLYVARNGNVSCEDLVGFAAIGSGYWHAESHFMANGHTKDTPLSTGVYLTYAAKRHAEIAPGVGKDTDMFAIGPSLGSYGPISPSVMQEFKKIYEKAQVNAKRTWQREKGAIQKLLDKLVQASEERAKAQKEQTPIEGEATRQPDPTPPAKAAEPGT